MDSASTRDDRQTVRCQRDLPADPDPAPARDVHGGRAVCNGPSNYLYNAYSAVPVAITVEGANILTRTLIVFGQGAIRCHPWLLKEIDAAGEQDYTLGLAKFDRAIRGHIGDILSNIARAFFKNLTGGLVGSDPSIGEVNYWYAQLERASASFATVADLSLAQLGGALKRKERLSGRFADAFAQLYLLSASLKRFEDDGRPQAELPVIEYVCTAGLKAFYDALDEILQNLPSRSSAWLLRRIVFPWRCGHRSAKNGLRTVRTVHHRAGSRCHRTRTAYRW